MQVNGWKCDHCGMVDLSEAPPLSWRVMVIDATGWSSSKRVAACSSPCAEKIIARAFEEND